MFVVMQPTVYNPIWASLILFSLCFCTFLHVMNNTKKISVEFEIHGRVQGVFFRKYTQQQSKKLGLKGWCMNTEKGTVLGLLQGENNKVNDMKQWLQNTGSPSSRIDKAEFRNEAEIEKYTFSDFKIKH